MTSAAWILVIACGVCLGWAVFMTVVYATGIDKHRKIVKTNHELRWQNAELLDQIKMFKPSTMTVVKTQKPADKTGYLIKEEVFA